MRQIRRRSFNLAFLIGVTQDAFAEEKYWPGKRILTSQEKIERSFAAASLILVGRFVRTNTSKPRKVDDEIGFLSCTFEVLGRLDRAAPLGFNEISLTIPAYLPIGVGQIGGEMRQAVDLSGPREMERNLGGAAISESDYLEAIRATRVKVLGSTGHLERFFVTSVRVGDQDSPYRRADVVVQFGREYVLFLTRRSKIESSITIFSNEFDIYDSEDSDFKRVAALRR